MCKLVLFEYNNTWWLWVESCKKDGKENSKGKHFHTFQFFSSWGRIYGRESNNQVQKTRMYINNRSNETLPKRKKEESDKDKVTIGDDQITGIL